MSCCIFHIVHTSATSKTVVSYIFKEIGNNPLACGLLESHASPQVILRWTVFSRGTAGDFKAPSLLRFSRIASVVWVRWHLSRPRSRKSVRSRNLAGSSSPRLAAFFEELPSSPLRSLSFCTTSSSASSPTVSLNCLPLKPRPVPEEILREWRGLRDVSTVSAVLHLSYGTRAEFMHEKYEEIIRITNLYICLLHFYECALRCLDIAIVICYCNTKL